MFSFLSGERKENQSESHKPAWAGPLRPPVSGTHIPRKNILRGFSSVLFLPFSFLSGERKENQKRKPGTRLGRSAAPARQRNVHSPQKTFCGAFQKKAPQGKTLNK